MKPVRPALIYPAEIALGGIMFAVAVIFTLFPEALEHSPINFENRGAVHHAWHSLLFASSWLVLVSHYYHGRFGRYAPRARLVGLLGLMAALLVNLIAVVAADFERPPIEAGGIDVGLRAAAIVFLAVRVRAIVNPPAIAIDTEVLPDDGTLRIVATSTGGERSILRRVTRRDQDRGE